MDLEKDKNNQEKSLQYVKYRHNMNPKDRDNEDECIINFIDKAVYCYLRKFMNSKTFSTFVSVDKISQDFGLTRPTINKSIQNLINNNFIEKKKKGRGYEYIFKDKRPKKFERISFELLDMKIAPKLKAFCIAMQEYLVNKETGVGTCNYSPTQMAKELGMSYNSYKKYVNECKDLGIIVTDFTTFLDLKNQPLQFSLEKLGQAILYVNEKVNKNTEDINKNTEDINKLKEELNQLKQMLNQ